MDIGNSRDFCNFFFFIFLFVTAWKKVDRKIGEQGWYTKCSMEKGKLHRICNKFTVREIKNFRIMDVKGLFVCFYSFISVLVDDPC